MDLRWSWSFGNESTSDLSAMGWDPSALGLTLTSDADKVYSYSGSPTRYGWIFSGNQGSMGLPSSIGAGLTEGWLAAPIKGLALSGLWSGVPILRATGASGENIDARITSSGALSLYVSDTFQETTPAIDWLSWRYVALRFDFSSDPWTGQIFVDGVAQTALRSQSDAPDTVANLRISGPSRLNTPDAFISQVVVWDSVGDSGETPVYATRVEPTSDGTSIGTWTPSTGSDDFAVVASPFDSATYTQEASPSASDRVEVVTSTIATGLGISPGSIAGVTAHSYSEGQSLTARAIVGDGGAGESAGAATAISAGSTSYAYATAAVAPTSGSSWLGSESVDLVYEVVTV